MRDANDDIASNRFGYELAVGLGWLSLGYVLGMVTWALVKA